MTRAVTLSLILVFLFACAGTRPQADWSAAQYFHYAKQLYDDEDYYDAVNEFTVVVLRYAGTSVADSAQYFLAEAHYEMGEYLIAAVEHQKLINNMSRSPLVPNAQFRLAECYYSLSPRPSLDQQYTDKAIRAYQTFIDDFPTHELKENAEKRIGFLRSKLAKKAFKSAEIYHKMREYDAAIIYFDQVLEKFYDTEWADDATIGKARVYIDMEDFLAAKKELEKFSLQFPDSELKNKVPEITSKISGAENDE